MDVCGQRIRFVQADMPSLFSAACTTTDTCLHPTWINPLHTTLLSSAEPQHLLLSEHQEPPHCWIHTFLTNVRAAPRTTWVLFGSKPSDQAPLSQALWQARPWRAEGLSTPWEMTQPAKTTATAALGILEMCGFHVFPNTEKHNQQTTHSFWKPLKCCSTQSLSASSRDTTRAGCPTGGVWWC